MRLNPTHSVKWPASPVTICIGFTFKTNPRHLGTIVLASDSRISVGSTVTHDAKKITAIKFKNGHALIAKAGYRHSFNRFEEMFSDRAADTEITSPRTIPRLAEDVIRELQRELLDRNSGDAAQRLRDSYCEFIIAFYHEAKPYLYTLDIINRIAEPSEKTFVSIGNASTLADFLLTAINPNKLRYDRVFHVAVGVIEMCKVHDSSCGGPCRVGCLSAGKDSGFLIAPNEKIYGLSRSLLHTDTAHKKLLRLFASDFKSSK